MILQEEANEYFKAHWSSYIPDADGGTEISEAYEKIMVDCMSDLNIPITPATDEAMDRWFKEWLNATT